jgi:hypothetical protein
MKIATIQHTLYLTWGIKRHDLGMPLHAELGKRGCRQFSSDVGPAMELSKGVTLSRPHGLP